MKKKLRLQYGISCAVLPPLMFAGITFDFKKLIFRIFGQIIYIIIRIPIYLYGLVCAKERQPEKKV